MSILTRVQANPEISTDNATFVADLVTRAKDLVVAWCHLPRFPELLQGYSVSAASPSTDLTALATNAIKISVNGSAAEEVTPDLANCDTGANTAAELQSVIRAVDSTYHDEVTVTYADSKYTITSGRYGEDSYVNVTFDEDYKEVAQAMKLSPDYGGVEKCGMAYDEEIETATVMLVEAMYARAGEEGVTSGSLPDGFSFTLADLDPYARGILITRRRGWST